MEEKKEIGGWKDGHFLYWANDDIPDFVKSFGTLDEELCKIDKIRDEENE